MLLCIRFRPLFFASVQDHFFRTIVLKNTQYVYFRAYFDIFWKNWLLFTFTIPILHPLFLEWLINIHVYCRTEIILFYEHKWFAANKVQLRRKHAIFSKMAYTRMPSHEIKRKARQVLLHLLTKVSHLDKGICWKMGVHLFVGLAASGVRGYCKWFVLCYEQQNFWFTWMFINISSDTLNRVHSTLEILWTCLVAITPISNLENKINE